MEQEDEISIKDIIHSLKEFFVELKSKWLFISIVVSVCFVIAVLLAVYSINSYTATSTVMLENSKGGEMAGAMALASQFGLGGGGGSTVIDEEKLLDIISSETIIRSALLRKIEIDKKEDFLANHLIDIYEYNEGWKKMEQDSLEGFRFKYSNKKMNLLENRVFKMLYSKITKSFLTAEKSKSGIIKVTVTTKNEAFSKFLNQYVIEALTHFYVDRITKKGRTNVAIIQKRVDSIAVELRGAEIALARWKDANFKLVKAQGMMEEMDLRRNVEVNNSIYIEGIKQLEISKFNLLQETPFLQIIDAPSLPLAPEKRSPIKFGVIGFILGLFLSSLYVFVRKKYAEIMREVGEMENKKAIE